MSMNPTVSDYYLAR